MGGMVGLAGKVISLPLVEERRQADAAQAILQGGALAGFGAICQPGMVAGDAVGQEMAQVPVTLYGQHRPPGRMIDANRIARDAALEIAGVLADVVKQA